MKKFLKYITRPPYAGLPWLLLAYVAISSLIIRSGGIFDEQLIGFDDQVRMTQVLNWINGAGWYDRVIMRANPPDGFASIWSRIVDIPIALVVMTAQQFVQQRTAALIAAAIIPLIELIILFKAAAYFVRPLVGKNKANLISLFLIFTSLLNFKYFSFSGFLIGQVSHHPWYIILNLLMLGAVARIAIGSAKMSPIGILGASAALFSAVGIEGYPLIAGAAGVMALVSWLEHRPIVASRGGDGLIAGALGALLLLPAHQPPEKWFYVSFAEPSIVGVIMILAAGVFLKLEHAILSYVWNRKAISAVSLLATAAAMLASLAWAFPDMLNGAAAGLSPEERQMALSIHLEAMSIYRASRSAVEFISLSAPIFIALFAGAYAFFTAKRRRRTIAFCYFGFAAVGGGMSFIFSRYYHHAMTTACAWLLCVWEEIKQRIKKNTNYSMISATAFIALCPLWMLLIPVMESDGRFVSQILLFPAAMQATPNVCNVVPTTKFINSHYDENTLLLVPQSQSANFLYQSKTRLDFIANFPSQNKFIDNFNFFGTTDHHEAADIANRHGIDIIAACVLPWSYNPNASMDNQPFIALLQTGNAPKWLTPVELPEIQNFKLYEVNKAALAQYTASNPFNGIRK